MKQLKLDIKCGDETCASKPGMFCIWCSHGYEFKECCKLFNEELSTGYGTMQGWLMRCKKCLNAEIK